MDKALTEARNSLSKRIRWHGSQDLTKLQAGGLLESVLQKESKCPQQQQKKKMAQNPQMQQSRLPLLRLADLFIFISEIRIRLETRHNRQRAYRNYGFHRAIKHRYFSHQEEKGNRLTQEFFLASRPEKSLFDSVCGIWPFENSLFMPSLANKPFYSKSPYRSSLLSSWHLPLLCFMSANRIHVRPPSLIGV